MKKFVTGIIFFIITIVACIFTTYILVDALRIQGGNSAEGLALIITLPLALISFAIQVISGIISEGFLFSYFKSEKSLLGPSIILTLLICASWIVDIIYFTQLLI